MIRVYTFLDLLNEYNINFFTGVPDSKLQILLDAIMSKYSISDSHIIAANEGNAVGIAAGYNLSTGNYPCVYLQNSGIGNIVNPVASLLNEKIYSIPILFIIGFRGEPNLKDEPQHLFQGDITLKLLECLNIEYVILDKYVNDDILKDALIKLKSVLDNGKQAAFVIKEGVFYKEKLFNYKNNNTLVREDAIKNIVKYSNDDIIVSTTGKISRELFEIRDKMGGGHTRDFLTVGSMGHSSMIAFSIALQKKNRRVFCLDGDGSVLMHMGALAIIGSRKPNNFIHIVLNNFSHESVGGMPTVCDKINLTEIAKNCGYEFVKSVDTIKEMDFVFSNLKNVLTFIEIKVSIFSRNDLMRPNITPLDNKNNFIEFLRKY